MRLLLICTEYRTIIIERQSIPWPGIVVAVDLETVATINLSV
jgi:hypothetical protein